MPYAALADTLSSACASVRGKPSVFFNQATMIMPWRSGLNLEALDVDAEQDLDAVADLPGGLSWGHSPIALGERASVAEVIGPSGSDAPSPPDASR